jgi:hypothetical protein
MITTVASPTRAKKRLGRFLTELRERAGRTLIDAATELKMSDSTTSRHESGLVVPIWSTVLTLLRFYGASDEEQATAARLWDDVNDDAPPVRLPVGATKAFRRLVSAEREAGSLRILESSVVPGLLQTERYVRAVNVKAHYHTPDGQVESYVQARLNRQRRLDGPDPLAVHAVLDEAAIRREVGGPEVMREQLAHLLVVGAWPHITLQVIAFGVGSYGTMSGSSWIIGYPDADDPAGVYLEYPAGGAWVEDVGDVQRFVTMFDDAAQLALRPPDTADLIREQMKALEPR